MTVLIMAGSRTPEVVGAALSFFVFSSTISTRCARGSPKSLMREQIMCRRSHNAKITVSSLARHALNRLTLAIAQPFRCTA
ncbi:hypothetical protein BDW75DRAFT_224125 [Aspergillus navahoensis]